MMRSLYSAVSGLRNHQTRMDVVANNISNVNTVGFKASRVIFQDIYSQTARNASAATSDGNATNPTYLLGGTNPSQIGLGLKLAAVDVVHTPAATARTDNPLDIAIEGDGFFVIKQGANTYYTRAGNFYVDNAGNLVTSGGDFVMGVPATQQYMGVADGTDLAGLNVPITVLDSLALQDFLKGATMQSLSFAVNLTDNSKLDVSLGSETVTLNDLSELNAVTFTNAGVTIDLSGLASKLSSFDGINDITTEVTALATDNNIAFTMLNNLSYTGTAKGGDFGAVKCTVVDNKLLQMAMQGNNMLDVTFAEDGTGGVQITVGGETITVTSAAQLNGAVAFANSGITLDLTSLRNVINFTDPASVTASVAAMKNDNRLEFTGKIDASTITTIGGLNDYINIAIDERGVIRGIRKGDPDGKKIEIAQIILATFENPTGLEKKGNSLYGATANSGNPNYNTAGVDGAGKMNVGGLEMSNVDLAGEFTDMIITQRGFQANSRVITVSDSMLEELVNLKR